MTKWSILNPDGNKAIDYDYDSESMAVFALLLRLSIREDMKKAWKKLKKQGYQAVQINK